MINENSSNRYEGDGTTAVYPYTFKVFLASHIKIVVKGPTAEDQETTLVQGVDYTVSGVGNKSGGNITLTDPLLAGYAMIILRSLPVTQDADIRNQGDYYPDYIENNFDKIVMLIQQQGDILKRVLRFGDTLPPDFDIMIPFPVPEGILGFDEDGDGVRVFQPGEFIGPTGPKGDSGEMDSIEVEGEIEYDDPTPMSARNVGTTTNADIRLVLRIGPKGEKGESTVLVTVAPTEPDDLVGADGDMWFLINNGDPLNGNVYQKVSGTYELKGSIMGPAGGVNSIDGEQGDLEYKLSGFSKTLNKLIDVQSLRDFMAVLADIQYTPPTITLASDIGVGPYEKGQDITAINFTASVEVKSDPIAQVQFLRGATVLDTQTSGGAIPNGGNSTYAWAGSMTDTTTFSARATDNGDSGGPTQVTANRTFNYVFAYFRGAGLPGLNAAGILALTKEVINSAADKTVSFTMAIGQVPYFAYPASYGDLTIINDANGFDVTSSFTKKTLSITNVHGQTANYSVYEHNNPWGLAETTTFRFRR